MQLKVFCSCVSSKRVRLANNWCAKVFACWLLVSAALSGLANSQEQGSPPTLPTPTPGHAFGPTSFQGPLEAEVTVEDVNVKNRGKERVFGVGDTIQVTLSGRIKDPKRELVIYVNDVPFAGCELPTGDDMKVEFRMDRNSEDEARKEAWSRLLARPKEFTREDVLIQVGRKDLPPYQASKNEAHQKLSLIVLWKWGFWIYCILLGLLLLLVYRLAKDSNLLRDRAPDGSTLQGPYSLARCQMAFWFVIVLATYCFIWLVTGSVDSLSNSALALLAISGGTGFISTIIDRSKQASVREEIIKGKQTEAALTQSIQSAGGFAMVTESAELAIVRKEVEKAEDQLKMEPSKTFIRDILTDSHGITVHRLQIFAWTVVMGVIFLVAVYQNLAMPELSNTLLGLMGLSSATYLGLKGPEK